jgi:glycosyltransferase involved in cell wall biosynthesis
MANNEALCRLNKLSLGNIKPFILHVGGNQWYKNRSGVIRIFAELIKRPGYDSHKLVMVGKPWTDELHHLVLELGLQKRVMELVGISNEDLRALYTTAEALLFPSLQEGFGWPIAEAQACGCPVISTNRAPMNDVGGSAVIYIDPADNIGAANLVAVALTERERWRIAGFENVRRFSLESMIESYVNCYQMVRLTVQNESEKSEALL